MADSPDDAPAPPEAGPTPDPKVEDPALDAAVARGRKVRLVALAAVLAVATILVVGIVRSGGRGPGEDLAGAIADGGAAVQVPKRPTLPGDPVNGVRLSGFVVDGTNAPVIGAEVTAELEKGFVDKALTGPAPGAGSAAAGVIAAAPTATDGRFLLDVPAPGRYRIRVTGKGLIPAELRYVPVPSDEARIVVARRVSIEGTVVDGTTPIANATVGLRGEAIGGGIEVKTDAKGAFKIEELPEGRYQLFAWRDTLAARAVRVNRLGAGPFPPIELALEAGAIVVGRVVDREEGVGLIAAIELRPSGDDQAPRYARSASDGTFRIEGVPHGKWMADAFAPGYLSSGVVELDAGRGIPELTLDKGGVIEGQVIDRDGKPIANAAVRALTVVTSGTPIEHSAAVDLDRLRRFSGRIAAPVQTTSSAVGTSADPQLLPRGELGVMVGPIPPIPPPGAQVARPATIDVGYASSLVGEPAPLATGAGASIWITGTDRRYRIAGLPKGKHVVLAVAPSFAEGRSKQAPIDLKQLVSGIDITLGPGTMIAGKVTDQHGVRVSGAQIHAAPEVGSPLDAFTDADGMYKLGPVTGQVVLTASAFGHADLRRTVEVAIATSNTPDERREDFTLIVADAVLSGTLDDAAGAPVPAAQIEVISGAGGGRQAVVGPDGTFSIDHLPAGPLRVRVTHPSYPTAELDAVATTGDREKVRLRLPLGGAIEGVLLDGTTGAPLAGLVISGYGPNGATADTTSEATGRWKLGPLRPGKWRLTIEQPGYLAASREVDVRASRAPGETSVHDIRFDLAKGALVGGTVRDGRGQRVVGATVTVQRASGDGPTATGTTDSQGEFRIRDAPTGELTIQATSGGLAGTATLSVRPGDEILGLSVTMQ
jgi:hypothetical protein